MKKQTAIIVCILLCLPSLWFGSKIARVFWQFHKDTKLFYARHDQLLKPEVFTPAAYALAQLCQEGQTNQYELTNLVPPMTGDYLGSGWATFGSGGVEVEFGSGFWHFGYKLERDMTSSSAETNYWSLTMYTEGSTNKTLLQFSTLVNGVVSHLKVN